jgi:tight adherence protein C
MLGPAVVVFGAVVLIVLALGYAFSGGSLLVTERLGRLWRLPGGGSRMGLKEKRQELAAWILSGLARMMPTSSRQSAGAERLLTRAGYRKPEAALALRAARVTLSVVLLSLAVFTGFYRLNPIFILGLALLLGFFGPEFWLTYRVRKRQLALRLALPDALDLLVICVEAGLGLDQSLLYIGQELRIAHPELCEEFDLVNAEVHVGKTRTEALRSLASRTGVEDINALVATLIQTDRFGTSVAQSLRIHSDDLRTKRRQRAEEMAGKTTVKMVFPLVFFIFPALIVVILGPAVISLVHSFGQLEK